MDVHGPNHVETLFSLWHIFSFCTWGSVSNSRIRRTKLLRTTKTFIDHQAPHTKIYLSLALSGLRRDKYTTSYNLTVNFRPPFHPFSFPTQSDGVTIDLAGETIGVRSDALVNDPLEPRLFVYHRDGSALELLRNDDSQKWLERLSHNSPCQPNQQRFGEGVDRRSGEGAASAVDVREQECLSDPHSQGSRQVMYETSCCNVAAVAVHVSRTSTGIVWSEG